MRLTEAAHSTLREHLRSGDIAIDATLGNGLDALFLCQQLGPSGQFYGFDIQPAAVAQTQKRLAENNLTCGCNLFCASHAAMTRKLPRTCQGKISAVMFNLGYLPGSDKRISTTSRTTLKALSEALTLLRPGGLLSVIAYPGHTEGAKETQDVIAWAHELSTTAYTTRIRHSPTPTGPIWLLIKKT